MTDVDFRRELAGLLTGEPALGPDVTRALRGGRRAQARHRYVSSAAGLAGVAVIAGALPFGLSFLSPGGGAGVTPGGGASSPATTPSAAPIPAVDGPRPSVVPSPVDGTTPSSVPSPVAGTTPNVVPSPVAGGTAPPPVPSSGSGTKPATSVAPSPEPTVDQREPSADGAGLPSPVPSYPGWVPTP
jgi:hypothetical protein